eukprot:SAG22_NODE_9277_length_599_cov_0.866000_2_plen_66_part_01
MDRAGVCVTPPNVAIVMQLAENGSLSSYLYGKKKGGAAEEESSSSVAVESAAASAESAAVAAVDTD